jgi:hypothetical protein
MIKLFLKAFLVAVSPVLPFVTHVKILNDIALNCIAHTGCKQKFMDIESGFL